MAKKKWNKNLLADFVIEAANFYKKEPKDLTEKEVDAYGLQKYKIKYMNKSFENHFGKKREVGAELSRFNGARTMAQSIWEGNTDEYLQELETMTRLQFQGIAEEVGLSLGGGQSTIYESPIFKSFDIPEELAKQASYPDVARNHRFTITPNSIIICVPDMHLPFVNQKWLIWMLQEIRTLVALNPEKEIHVVALGDAFDLYTLSRYEKKADISVELEISTARKQYADFWDSISSSCKKYALIGNHEARSAAFAAKVGVNLSGYIPTPKALVSHPGVYTVDSDKCVLIFQVEGGERLQVLHGYLSQSVAHFRKLPNGHIAHGHLHSAGVVHFDEQFCMSCGHGMDTEAISASYAHAASKKNTQLGFGKVKVDARGKMQAEFVRYV